MEKNGEPLTTAAKMMRYWSTEERPVSLEEFLEFWHSLTDEECDYYWASYFEEN